MHSWQEVSLQEFMQVTEMSFMNIRNNIETPGEEKWCDSWCGGAKHTLKIRTVTSVVYWKLIIKLRVIFWQNDLLGARYKTNVAKDYPYSHCPVCCRDAFKCAVFHKLFHTDLKNNGVFSLTFSFLIQYFSFKHEVEQYQEWIWKSAFSRTCTIII